MEINQKLRLKGLNWPEKLWTWKRIQKKAGVPHGKPTRIKTFLRLAFLILVVRHAYKCTLASRDKPQGNFYFANIKTKSDSPITPPPIFKKFNNIFIQKAVQPGLFPVGNGQTSRANAHSPIRIFWPKNLSTFHLLCYLFVFKTFEAEQLGIQTFQQWRVVLK